jgi:hypothetical protein
VHVRSGPLLADERALAADVDRDVRAVDELEILSAFAVVFSSV